MPSAAAIVELHKMVALPTPSFMDRLSGRAGLVMNSPIPAERTPLEVALDALVQIADWRAIPYLTWLLAVDDTRRMALRAIRALMPRDCDALRRLDEGVREAGYTCPGWWPQGKPFPWPRRLDDRYALAVVHEAVGDAVVAGFLSFSPNGHAREAAVRALAACNDGREVPFLLLRINDWVEPVSRYALSASSARLRSGYERHFASSLPLVARLRQQRRWDHIAFVDLVERFHSETDDGRRAVLDGFQGDLLLRRVGADLVSRRFPGGAQLVEQLFGLLDDGDSVVRSRMVDAVARLASDSEVQRLIQRTIGDHSASIRRRAFAVAEARMPALADELALQLIFDRNAWLREFARQRLQKLGVADFADRYRNAITSGVEIEGALLGLMETGSQKDAPLVAPLVDMGSSRVRRAALRAATSLDSEKAGSILVKAVASPRPGLSHAAAVGVVNGRAFVPAEELDRLLGAGEPHVRRNVLRVLAARDPWTSSGQRSEITRMITDLDDFPEVRTTLEQLLHA